jgi:hypothetical protein
LIGAREPARAFRRLYRIWSPDRGIISGCVFISVGLIASLAAVLEWRARHFSNIDPQQVLRRVIPAFACLALGCQLTLASLFLGFLELRLRTSTPAPVR